MNLAAAHEVPGKRSGIPGVIAISYHPDIAFGIAVHGIANQDQSSFFRFQMLVNLESNQGRCGDIHSQIECNHREIPNPNTSSSLPSSANDIIDKVEIIGVINTLTASLNTGFSLSQPATVGANE